MWVDSLHILLFVFKGRCPLVILLCESESSREFHLFPQELKTELDISSITFNPVAATFLTKAVKNIIQQANSVSLTSSLGKSVSSFASLLRHSDDNYR